MSLDKTPKNTPLFREEALDFQQTKWLGEVVVIRRLSFAVVTMMFSAITLALVLFLALGTYTRRTTVVGQLIPNIGVVKVYPLQPGIVIQRYVHEGQAVHKGDILFRISSDRRYSPQQNVQTTISGLVQTRLSSLQDELSRTKLVQEKQNAALAEKVSALQGQRLRIKESINLQKRRVELAEAEYGRYKALAAQDYVSKEECEQKEADVVEQRFRLGSLERDLLSTEGELASARSAFQAAGMQNANELSQLQRQAAVTSQELAESEGKASSFAVATESGTATVITAHVGQIVDGTQPIVSILPRGARLDAYLYAPSSAIGFIKSGQRVLLRFQAYPYQKFGTHEGVVTDISDVALMSNELTGIRTTATEGAQPVYRITVRLKSQTILAYGRTIRLQPGMLIDADILQDTRRLYEWFLEPLYSITGHT